MLNILNVNQKELIGEVQNITALVTTAAQYSYMWTIKWPSAICQNWGYTLLELNSQTPPMLVSGKGNQLAVCSGQLSIPAGRSTGHGTLGDRMVFHFFNTKIRPKIDVFGTRSKKRATLDELMTNLATLPPLFMKPPLVSDSSVGEHTDPKSTVGVSNGGPLLGFNFVVASVNQPTKAKEKMYPFYFSGVSSHLLGGADTAAHLPSESWPVLIVPRKLFNVKKFKRTLSHLCILRTFEEV